MARSRNHPRFPVPRFRYASSSRLHFHAGPRWPAVPIFRSNALASVLRAEHMAGGRSAAPLAEDEAHWGEIQRAFDADRTLIN